jgi:hypothetical protein
LRLSTSGLVAIAARVARVFGMNRDPYLRNGS